MSDDLTPATWRKSTHSGNDGACVEIAELADGHRAVRDSKNPTGAALIVTSGQWSVFAADVKAGELDY